MSSPKDFNVFARRRWVCLISAMVICICAGFGYAGRYSSDSRL